MRRVLDGVRTAGAEYADIRMVDRKSESMSIQDQRVVSVDSQNSKGFGVRVLKDGAWGFFGVSGQLDEKNGFEVARRALAASRASGVARKDKPVKLVPLPPSCGEWSSPVDIDPFEVKLEDKIGLLKDATRLAMACPLVKSTQASMEFYRTATEFLSTEGVSFEQTITESGAGMAVFTAYGGDSQRRSYPNSSGGNYCQAGYEAVLDIDLVGHAEECARAAAELVKAPACPHGVKDVILDSSQLQMQIHESCGHAFELDRILGSEAGFWGGSFLQASDLGKYHYGSAQCNLTADATTPGGLGSLRWDDEGIPGQRTPLVTQGVVTNYLSSRETASELGLGQSNGTMRADGWGRMPMIRMTNINLEPGDWTKDEIIRDTKDGILMETAKAWSIDDRRWDFQMGTEVGWLIKDGSLEGMVKNPSYGGITPEFWRSLDAVASKDEWKVYNMTGCGKGEPGQNVHVGHGSSPARFRKVRVGV